MYNYFLNYCNDTTVHGFKYYGEKHRNKAEKYFHFNYKNKIQQIFVSDSFG